MVNMTLAIPDELAKRMKTFSEIRWSEVARQALEKRVNDLEIMNNIASKSKLTQKDVDEISKRIKRSSASKLNGYRS
ncbi:hypothetical protein J4205_00475 [Candidatus Pacearchaeota archaeon]|nr:hypothetical protein [Candidatus Pacearchaeota archaeon]